MSLVYESIELKMLGKIWNGKWWFRCSFNQ